METLKYWSIPERNQPEYQSSLCPLLALMQLPLRTTDIH